nr:DUF4158 domain-containing protein [Escherichia coli]EKU0875205.1 DUF4158 domain-containing protein [Escherichia coli]
MPSGVRHFTARQLGIRDITVLAEYGQRENTRREHAALIRQHYQLYSQSHHSRSGGGEKSGTRICLPTG